VFGGHNFNRGEISTPHLWIHLETERVMVVIVLKHTNFIINPELW
jgi:hypothetical protein